MPGPAPTFAEIWTQLGKTVKVIEEVENFGNSNTPNYLDMEEALTAVLEGEYTPVATEALRRLVRQPLASALAPSNLRLLLRPFLHEFARLIDAPELKGGTIPDATALKRIRQYMVENDQWIKSRGMTLDASATSTGTGSGAWNRLTVDKDENTLECTGGEAKVFYCDKDQTSGARKHAEEFELRFAPAEQDGLYWTGTGGTKRIRSLHALSGQLLVNPSFETGALTTNTALASTGQLTGWDVTTAANWKTRSTAGYTYRGYVGEPSTLWGLECTASDQIAQVIRAENPGAAFSAEAPYYCAVAWQRKASATGTLTLHLGSQSVAVDISTGTNDAWNVLKIPMGTGCWYDNFLEGDLDVKLVVASLATGTVVIDDVILAPMTNLDGTWWAVVGGATPWLRGGTHTFTDADGGTRALFSYWLWRAFGDDAALLTAVHGWIPTAANATEITAAGGRTLTFDESDKTITASSGDFDADGYKPGMLLTVAGTSNNNVSAQPIASVTATVLTLTNDVLTDEGALSATATLNATPSILDPT